MQHLLLIASGRLEDLLHLVSLTMVLTGTLTVSCVFAAAFLGHRAAARRGHSA